MPACPRVRHGILLLPCLQQRCQHVMLCQLPASQLLPYFSRLPAGFFLTPSTLRPALCLLPLAASARPHSKKDRMAEGRYL